MKGNRKLLLFAVLIGIVTVVALNSYIKGLDTPALANIPHTNVVVAKNTIPSNTRITSDMLEVSSIPADAAHPEALRSIEDAAGGISRTEIIKGEQVLAARVVTEERRATFSYRVPEGMRAISIPVGEVSGVSGYITPGDTVDVLVSYSDEDLTNVLKTYTVLQNVKVLASGPVTHEQDDEESEIVSSVILAVTPGQAEVLAYSNLAGSFHLTLRSPLDDKQVGLEYFSSENFDSFRGR